MYDFSKASDTQKYFEEIIKKSGNCKIIGIFCKCSTWFNDNGNYVYMQDEPLFVIFDNGKCFVIEYFDIDKFSVEYRNMTDAEQLTYRTSERRDIFNRITDIYDIYTGNKSHTEKSALDYGKLKQIEIKRVTNDYSAWVNGNIAYNLKPTGETFNEVKFVMDNGKSFSVCPADPENDGYSLIWSDDADTSDNVL